MRVTFTAPYSLGGALYFDAAIVYQGDGFVQGTVTSSPDSCEQQSANLAGLATCNIVAPGAPDLKGVEYLTFELTFQECYSYPCIKFLEAQVAIEDGAYNLINKHTQDFTISVVAPSSFATSTQVTTQASTTPASSYIYSSSSTVPLQMPQPTQSTNSQPVINELALVIAGNAAIALAVLLNLRRTNQSKSTKVKKFESKTKRVTSSKGFCIECDAELPK